MIKTIISGTMIKELFFGDGDIISSSFTSKSEEGIGLSMSRTEPGEVGRTVEPLSREDFFQNGEVLMFFKNIESLDSVIGSLQNIREYFTDKEGNKADE